jgi:hypothetical protein
MIYTAAEAPLAPETNPWAALKRLLGDIGKTGSELEQLKAERRSVLDVLDGELVTLQGKIGAADKRKVDAHLTAVREIEMRLQNSSVACEGPVLGTEVDANKSSNTPVVMDAMISLMTSSLACGLTRFASMQYRVGENDGGYLYDWLGLTTLEHHLLTHEPDSNAAARADLTKIYTWYTEMFAKFLERAMAACSTIRWWSGAASSVRATRIRSTRSRSSWPAAPLAGCRPVATCSTTTWSTIGCWSTSRA